VEIVIMSKDVILFIDITEARIFDLDQDLAAGETILEPIYTQHHKHEDHEKHGEKGKERRKERKDFFHEVSKTLRPAERILVTGPGMAKLALLRYMHKHAHSELERRVIGVQTIDSPSDKQLFAYGKKYFNAIDQPA
jgi:stalled ribosome rescue protein Dom34